MIFGIFWVSLAIFELSDSLGLAVSPGFEYGNSSFLSMWKITKRRIAVVEQQTNQENLSLRTHFSNSY